MFRIDKRVWYIILGIVVFRIILNSLSDTNTAITTLLMIPAVLIAITFHEFAHAYTANKLGDNTAKEQGRLNLNPLNHVDLVGLIMLLTIGIGWGKPVQVDYRNLNGKTSVTKAEALISIAGPVMNFIVAIIFALIYGVIVKFNLLSNFDIKTYYYIVLAIGYIIMLNIGLGVFNLIPLPPLDGSKVLKYFLPQKSRIWFEEKESIFYIVFIIIWITGIAGIVVTPLISIIGEKIMQLVGIVFGF
ncbi:MAG TPA: site-2 protease family protein [Clostridia bacterium]|nr:site-2 protease family protein [Clostridia bacterium]